MSNRSPRPPAERNRPFWELDENLPLREISERITRLVEGMAKFWSNCSGWAPEEAAKLLSEARLDRVASLSASLIRWIEDDDLSDGDLILAWTNLGSVMEGVLKIFLCVYLNDYRADDLSRKTRAYRVKEGALRDPDELNLDTILKYVGLAELLPAEDISLATLTQSRRNAIHAFQDRPLGTTEEFRQSLRRFREMAVCLHYRLPYPDEMGGFAPI